VNNFICVRCGVQYAATASPPAHCDICEDEREAVNSEGQQWTTQRWHDFYITAGGAAAVVLGLLFVSLSLHLNREASEYDVLYRVGTQTMIDLAYALAFAFLMLIPISDPTVLGGVLLVLSVGGALDSSRTIGQRGWLHGWTYYVSLMLRSSKAVYISKWPNRRPGKE
jgi:hypothetical protein